MSGKRQGKYRLITAMKRLRTAAALVALSCATVPATLVAKGVEGVPDSELGESETGEPESNAPPGVQAADDSPFGEVADVLFVTGGPGSIATLPGSGHFVGKLELARHEHSDIHRVLQQVEGVSVQEEDGFGLRPNIGMRGTGVNRSEKITLLEDGVLIAPAPYTAPAAYYFPTSERMEAIEVRKGSSAITQGPYTTGGVLNLVSRSIPASFGGRVKLAGGSHETLRAQGFLGSSRERFGWMLEGYRLDNEGFKELDGGGSTGSDVTDVVGKVRWNSGAEAERHQSLELKLARARQVGHETYLGLTQTDFDRAPLRRYAASQEDVFDADHDQIQVRYLATPAPRAFVAVTAYRNTFSRDWHKLQSANGRSLSEILDAPELYRDDYRLLAGEVDSSSGPLRTRHNRRDYFSQGFETRVTLSVGGPRVEHEIELGVRLHRDEEDRFQEEDRWNMVDGRMRLLAPGSPGSQSNRVSEAEARAFHVRDTMQFGDWTLSPGVRIERIDFTKRDFGTADPLRLGSSLAERTNKASVILPGIGMSYRLGENWNLLAGIHRGFSAPGPGQDPEVDAEESINAELGFDHRASRGSVPVGARAVAFVSDYDNLIGRDSLSTGGEGTSRTFNGGRALVRGLEAAVDVDFGSRASTMMSIPIRVGYTFTRAEFANSFETTFSDWAPEVSDGDRMPYLPEHQASLSAGFVADRWQAFAAVTYAGSMRTRPGQGPKAAEELIADHLLVDLSGRLSLVRRLELSVQARNVFDSIYVASRRPAGLRPGLPRTFLVGLSWEI